MSRIVDDRDEELPRTGAKKMLKREGSLPTSKSTVGSSGTSSSAFEIWVLRIANSSPSEN